MQSLACLMLAGQHHPLELEAELLRTHRGRVTLRSHDQAACRPLSSLDICLVAIHTDDLFASSGVSVQQIPHPTPCHTGLPQEIPVFTKGPVLLSLKQDRKTGPVSITMTTKRSSISSKKWSSFGGRASASLRVCGNVSGLPRNCTPGANGFGLDGAAMHTPSTLKTLHPSLRRGVDFIWDKLVQSSLTQELASPGVILG